MSVIAYASANANPQTAPLEDAEIDLSSVSLPTSIQLYGDAVDTADPTASFSWAWSLTDGQGAQLSATNTQNVTVSNITQWHNIRLHLVATNTTTLESSETDLLIAPSSSFVEIRVLSENRGIQKVAQGSRNWHPALSSWASAIEGSASTLQELTDVSTATGAQLDILVSGGSAEDGGSALHTHSGSHIASATPSAGGVVQLEEASSAVGVPRVITQERITFTAHVTKSHDGNNMIDAVTYQNNAGNTPHASHLFSENLNIIGFHITMMDGGDGTQYTFQLAVDTPANFGARNMALVGSSVQATPAQVHGPLSASVAFVSPVSVTAGAVFGVVITGGATTASAGGQMMTVTIEARRKVL